MSTPTESEPRCLRELAEQSNAWPFEEARKIVARLERRPKDEVVFETGYGPSGLPHIGTFGEVARTTMVRHAFRVLTDDKVKTRLIAFSDDMDGLRKVPDNVPNKELVGEHLGKPLTSVPDPFGTHASFGAHNNARLCAFLDQFGFDYDFLSSTDCYMSGRFDAALLEVLARFEAVMADHAAVAARGARANLFAVSARSIHAPASCCRCRCSRTTPRPAPSAMRIPQTQGTGDDARHRRAHQAAMEAGLGDALGRARRRLRDGRQGPDRFGQALRRDLPRARRHAAGRLQLRAVSRREGPEDLEVEGQRAHHRRMAALRQPGIAVAVHVSRAEGGEAPLLRRDPAARR